MFNSLSVKSIWESVLIPWGSIFSLIVPRIRNGLYGTKEIDFLKRWRPTVLISTPSIEFRPDSSSTKRYRVWRIELLPEPVYPMIPIRIPDLALKVKLLILGSIPQRYLIVHYSKSTVPWVGHIYLSSSSSPGLTSSSSYSSSVYAIILLELTMWLSISEYIRNEIETKKMISVATCRLITSKL